MMKGTFRKENLKHTPLHATFKGMGARFIRFAGWELAASFSTPSEEHRAVRKKAGLFDVTHMGEIEFRGKDSKDFLNYTLSNDVLSLKEGDSQYTLILNMRGGILDDAILSRRGGDHFHLCVNAANVRKDARRFRKRKGRFEVIVKNTSRDTGQLALQGPHAVDILKPLCGEDISLLKPFTFTETKLAGMNAVISRTGYTGEDGFEIYLNIRDLEKGWKEISTSGRSYGMMPAGLLARDTLRLEMKYPLHGNDIDENTTPLEANLGWVVKFDKGNFIGKRALLIQKEEGVKKRLVGFQMIERGIPRSGFPIRCQGKRVGTVTSGNLSPSLEVAIGLGYVQTPFSGVGTEIEVDIRGVPRKALIVKTPFLTRKRSPAFQA